MNLYFAGGTDHTLRTEMTKAIDWLTSRLGLSEYTDTDLDLTIDPDCDADGYTPTDRDWETKGS